MPRTQVKVREHVRRKPYQEERTHVDKYVREQELSSRLPAGPEDLGPINTRTCENCGMMGNMDQMVNLPGGEWYCKPCYARSKMFTRSGEDYDCEQLEQTVLFLLDLDGKYDRFDEVPDNVLQMIKCPDCEGTDFAVYGETEDMYLGGFDAHNRQIEAPAEFRPEEATYYLYCTHCAKQVNEALIVEDVKDALKEAGHAR